MDGWMDFFHVFVPINAKRQKLKEHLCDKLSESCLFGESASIVVPERVVVAGITAHKIKVRNHDLEVEAMH